MIDSTAQTFFASDFEYRPTTARIVFGDNSLAKVSEALDWIGASAPLVLCTPFQKEQAEQVVALLGAKAAGIYANATMHTPVEVTEQALVEYQRTGADCTIAIGGGSTTGLGKALAYRTGCKQIVIPTTYAGSEVTPVLGQTEKGQKTTFADPQILPDVVLYDPLLTYGLPVEMSLTSAFNALAHALEGLYAQNRNPVSSLMAKEGTIALLQALPLLKADPNSAEGRNLALYGAWLCGTVLGNVGMALHHKLCHTLGGSFGLPHAETHTVILPHAIQYNAAAVPHLLSPITDVLGGDQPGQALWDLARDLGAPISLKDLGMEEAQVEQAVEKALNNPYWNPREVTADGLRQILQNAWAGQPPHA